MIRESPELTAVAERWVSAFIGGDGDALVNLVSRDPAARFLGTDPDEFWRGEDVSRALPAHIDEIHERVRPKFDIGHLDPEFEFGPSSDVVLKGLDGTHQIAPLIW